MTNIQNVEEFSTPYLHDDVDDKTFVQVSHRHYSTELRTQWKTAFTHFSSINRQHNWNAENTRGQENEGTVLRLSQAIFYRIRNMCMRAYRMYNMLQSPDTYECTISVHTQKLSESIFCNR